MTMKLNDRVTVFLSKNECYTRLSIGGEESGNREVYTIHICNSQLVSFRYHLLWYYSISDGIEGFDLIFTNRNVNDLRNILRGEFYSLIVENYKNGLSDTNVEIAEQFINYINRDDNHKYISYII